MSLGKQHICAGSSPGEGAGHQSLVHPVLAGCRLVCLHDLDVTSRLSSHLSPLPLGPHPCAGGGRKEPQANREEPASPRRLGAGWRVLLFIHLQQIPQKLALLSHGLHPTFYSEPYPPASRALVSYILRLPALDSPKQAPNPAFPWLIKCR